MDSRNATIYYDTYDEEEEVQSELMPYYEDEEEEVIEVNDDSYWDIYYDPTGPDNLDTSFSD
jgi:hypothetical protein